MLIMNSKHAGEQYTWILNDKYLPEVFIRPLIEFSLSSFLPPNVFDCFLCVGSQLWAVVAKAS